MQPRLRGRQRECDVLDNLLASVRTGESRVLVLRGEAGIGKTALLEHLADGASGFRVARAAGVESEMGLPHAGLHQLCAPFADGIDSLPGPQRDALRTAFGQLGGDAPNRFLVGVAVLGLLSDVAEEAPLVWIVDDAHWLDEASTQTLAFVARRLEAESVGMVVAMRDHAGKDAFVGLDELVVRGLGERDARALLETVLTGPLDDRVRDRLVAETSGNPLALLELPRGLAPGEMAGGFGLPDASSLAGRIEESFRRRLAPLPSSTRKLLLVAQRSRPATRYRYGARLAPSAWSPQRGRQRGTSSSSADTCVSGIPSSDRPCTGRHRGRSASAHTARWPSQRTRRSIPTGAPGTARTGPRYPTRTSPPSSSTRPGVHGPRRPGRCRGVSRARGGVDARACAPSPAGARRGPEQAARRRA